MVNGLNIISLDNNVYNTNRIKKKKKQKRQVYCILAYDVGSSKRLPKILKLCRQFLHWVQNSTFEGELTEKQLDRLIINIKSIIDKEEDSVLIYTMRDKALVNKKVLGKEKNEISIFI